MSVESSQVDVDHLAQHAGRSGAFVEVVGSAADAVSVRMAGLGNGLTGCVGGAGPV